MSTPSDEKYIQHTGSGEFVDHLAADIIEHEIVWLSLVHSSPLNLPCILVCALVLMNQAMKTDGSK